MNVEKELKEIVQQVLENHQKIFLVQTHHSHKSHEIVIDGDKALGIYDISAVSREINHLADERMPEEEYSLDVTSPGADEDLLLLRQYPKHCGREFKLVLSDDDIFTGRLQKVIENELTFENTEKTKSKKNLVDPFRTFSFKDIKKANIILSFK